MGSYQIQTEALAENLRLSKSRSFLARVSGPSRTLQILAQISGSPGADLGDIISQVGSVMATSHLVTPTAPEPQLRATRPPPPKAALARPERGNAYANGIWGAPAD